MYRLNNFLVNLIIDSIDRSSPQVFSKTDHQFLLRSTLYLNLFFWSIFLKNVLCSILVSKLLPENMFLCQSASAGESILFNEDCIFSLNKLILYLNPTLIRLFDIDSLIWERWRLLWCCVKMCVSVTHLMLELWSVAVGMCCSVELFNFAQLL